MRTTSRFEPLLLIALGLAACATSSAPPAKIPADSRISVTVTRATERLHLQVLVAPRCDDSPCPAPTPRTGLSVAIRTPQGARELGSTSDDGGVDIALSQFDALFPSRTTDKYQRAALLVEGRVAAELPVGEIVQRKAILEATIRECDDALADPQLDHDYAQVLLGRMLDLQMRGMADARLAERASRLYDRLRETPSSWWSVPQRLLGKVKDLIASWSASNDDAALPTDVQQTLVNANEGDTVETSSFSWALESLPAICKITVEGSAIAAGQVVGTGVPGIALAIVGAAVGDDLSDWLVKSCCKMASDSLGDAATATCTTL